MTRLPQPGPGLSLWFSGFFMSSVDTAMGVLGLTYIDMQYACSYGVQKIYTHIDI